MKDARGEGGGKYKEITKPVFNWVPLTFKVLRACSYLGGRIGGVVRGGEDAGQEEDLADSEEHTLIALVVGRA